MSKQVNITVEERTLSSKGTMHKLRDSGLVPGIFYGKDVKQNIMLTFVEKDLRKALHTEAGLNVILNLTIKTAKGEQVEAVIPQDVTFHPITDRIEHIDLRKINLKEKITTKVPIKLVGTAPGVALGGILVQQMYEVEVRCLPTEIPSSITIDISSLDKVNIFLKAGEIKFPANVEPLHLHAEQAVVSIMAPKKEEDLTVAPLEQSAEPELLKTKGKEGEEEEGAAPAAGEKAPEKGKEAEGKKPEGKKPEAKKPEAKAEGKK